jgi:hypothetical protein
MKMKMEKMRFISEKNWGFWWIIGKSMTIQGEIIEKLK